MNSTEKKYQSSTTKKYWCYNCQKTFNKIYIENQQIECIFCYNQICEEINENSQITNPQNYIPYNPRRREEHQPQIIRISNPNNFLIDFVLNLINMEYEEEEIENILNYIMNNDTNRYGSPPASKSEIDKLNKYILTKEKLDNYGNENICSVCKEEFQIGNECMDLPCNHYFHKDCLMPWLNQHDSCPICRFELKTEDEDYEKMKRERNSRNVLNNSVSQVENFNV